MAVVALPHQPAIASAVGEQWIVSVEFRSAEGRTWKAIGGGESLAEAIEWARESCPPGAAWKPVGWQHLYGD